MVAMDTWPTDGAAGSVATEARWRKMARHWAPSGIAPGVGGELAPTLAMPNLTVQSGAAWVDGHYAELPTNQVLTATANGLAVVRFDPAANTADLLWRDGVSTPAQSPTGTWELPIARTAASVLTDLRGRLSDMVRFANAAARTVGMPTPGVNQLTMLDNRLGVPQYWTGSAWADQVPFIQWGTGSGTTNASGVCPRITFPVAFGATPNIFMQNYVASGHVVSIINASASWFDAAYWAPGGAQAGNASFQFWWLAIGNRLAAT